MDQDATWYGGRPWLRGHCVRWGPAHPKKEAQPRNFAAHVHCGQTAVCIRIPMLGTVVGLSLGDVVLDGDPALPPKRHIPQFWPMSVVAKWLDRLRCNLVWRYASAQATLCLMGTLIPGKKGHSPHPIFGRCLLWPNGWMDQDAN